MSSAEITFRTEHPGTESGVLLRRVYWAEVTAACGLPGGEPPAGDEHDLVAPRGTFVVASRAGEDLGCVGVRLLAGGDAEVKRLWVSPAARGLRLGTRLLEVAEEWARAQGATRLCLDTRRELAAAVTLYARVGYVEVEPYNENADADLWFAKPLV
ncbi:GNAT family N-acetyltransferase [Kineococcus gynurae]|uniref:GNAT family N-acetyltransferase n=1 Tax=Kineococcus gynurae TaxID=452979 RepID=A0ABV5LSM3_9ACTN